MKPATGTSAQPPSHSFYLYSSSGASSTLSSSNVFYRVSSEQLAKTLCRLFCKEYSSGTGEPGFLLKQADEVEQDEQVLLDEALDWLDVYDDPDPGIYDSPPPKEMMMRAEYARRARGWEATIVARTGDKKNRPIAEGGDQNSHRAGPEITDRVPDHLQMSAEDRRNSGLNLLFLLAQAYYEILERVISTASWCCALDLELNEAYLWTTTNLRNLLANHEDLRDFPGKFEPVFPDLYPSTIRDVDWEEMVAPNVEQFLSTVQKYVRSRIIYQSENSPSWRFVEMFRPSVNTAIERAVAYNKRMRNYARREFGDSAGTSGVQDSGTSGVAPKPAPATPEEEDLRAPMRGKPGRIPKLPQAFVVCAGTQWRAAISDSHARVSDHQLQQIACALDAAGHLPPAQYLEGKCSRELKHFNSRNSKSKIGPVQTWSQLVSRGDKDLLRGARRLFSRCAKKLDAHPLSGN